MCLYYELDLESRKDGWHINCIAWYTLIDFRAVWGGHMNLNSYI